MFGDALGFIRVAEEGLGMVRAGRQWWRFLLLLLLLLLGCDVLTFMLVFFCVFMVFVAEGARGVLWCRWGGMVVVVIVESLLLPAAAVLICGARNEGRGN